MSRTEEIKKELQIHLRRLQKLREKKAKYGLEVPVHIELEIEDIAAEIEQLQTELRNVEEEEALVHDPRRTQKLLILSYLNDFIQAGGTDRIPVDALIRHFKENGRIEKDLAELEKEGYIQVIVRRPGRRPYSYLEISEKGVTLLENEN